MSKIIITDFRELYDFKGVTFNNIKLNEVKKELVKCLLNNNCDQSLYWTCDILLSCNFIVLWEIYFYLLSNIISTSNLKFINFLYKKYDDFKVIINNCPKIIDILNLRTNENIINIFTDITVFICCTKKNNLIDYKKLYIKNFNFDKINNILKAPNINYVNNYFKDGDPKELYIILNEFIYNLEENNELETYKWVYIYLDYYDKCKKNKIILLCEDRSNIIDYINELNNTLKNHPIWILWSILLQKCMNHEKIITYNYIKKLLHFYLIQFSQSKIKTRINLLFFSIKIFLINENSEQFNIPILYDKNSYFKLVNISRKSFFNIIKKINNSYLKDNNNNIISQKLKKNDKVTESFNKLKVLDNIMFNKNSKEE